MTRTTVSATRPDKTDTGGWIDINSRIGRLMSTLMADGRPFSIDADPDDMTTVTPLPPLSDDTETKAADGNDAKTGTGPDEGRITSRKTLYERFRTKLKANLAERKQ